MKLKILVYAVLIMVFILIQSTVLEYAKIYGVKPNLIVVLVIIVALLRGNIEGAVIGFFTGMSQDILSGKLLGFYSLLGLYLGLIVGSVNKRLYRENILVVIFFTFTASVAYEVMVGIFGLVLKDYESFLFALKSIILPEAVYNSIISVIVFILVLKLNYKFEEISTIKRKY